MLIFFIPYVIFQPFATALIRKIGPRKFLSSMILAWAGVTIVWLPFGWVMAQGRKLMPDRELALRINGRMFLPPERFWVCSKVVTSPALYTCCRRGIVDVSRLLSSSDVEFPELEEGPEVCGSS